MVVGAKPPAKSEALLAVCTLAQSEPGACRWCGDALPKLRRTWCSDRCGTAFWKNHWWTLARSAAKRRDKYRCKECGQALPKRPARIAFRTEIAYKAAMRTWRSRRKVERLEVNHVIPCLGKHMVLSCLHHLDNLETLCVACHKGHTASAARARAVLKQKAKV